VGRKSVATIRRAEIVDAVQRCVVRKGLAAATMADVAREAGMQRSAISHFLGNREDVVSAAIERSCDYYIELIEAIVAEHPPERRVHALVDDLIGGKRANPDAMVLFDEIVAIAHHDEHARSEVERAYGVLDRELKAALRARYPDAPSRDRTAVAHALVLVIDNEERFRVLGLSNGRAARAAAGMLLDSLGGSDSAAR
jgi:AcrR family transcriptional regulator